MHVPATMYFTEEESQEILRARNFVSATVTWTGSELSFDEKFVADLFNPKMVSFFGGSQHKTQRQFDSNKCRNVLTFRKPAISSQLDITISPQFDINQLSEFKLECYELETIVARRHSQHSDTCINCYFCSEDSPEIKKALFLGSLYEEN